MLVVYQTIIAIRDVVRVAPSARQFCGYDLS